MHNINGGSLVCKVERTELPHAASHVISPVNMNKAVHDLSTFTATFTEISVYSSLLKYHVTI